MTCTGFPDPNAPEACLRQFLVENELLFLAFFSLNQRLCFCLLYFRKMGLTFEEKAFYDILIALRDQYNFEYGTDKEVNGIIINDKCKSLAKKVKDIIDTKSSFAD